ncbi:hypothetical protein VCHENC02_2724B, partial [Vibrio harveyi]
ILIPFMVCSSTFTLTPYQHNALGTYE